MRLRQVVIENVCQFAHFEHTFHAGLTGILGPIGSGKSNLTKAIHFALTGTFRNPGVKADNVAQLAAGARSCVSLWLEHGGVELEVRRYLAGGKTRLAVDDGEPILGDNAVTEKLMEVLGVDARLLGEYVFVLQLHMADFIEAAPADRARAFQRLFGADACEEVHAFAAKLLDKELAVSDPVDLPAVRARIAANEARMAEVGTRLENLDRAIDYHAVGEEESRRIVAEFNWCRQAHEESDRLGYQVDRLAEEHATASAVVDECEAKAATLAAALRNTEGDAERARVQLATWRTVQAQLARKASLDRRRQKLEAQVKTWIEPTPIAEFRDEDRDLLRQLAVDRDRSRRILALADSGKPECPTCGLPTSELPSTTCLRDELARLDERVDGLEEWERLHREYLAAHGRWRTWYQEHRANTAELEADEAALAAERESGPEAGPAQLQAIVDGAIAARAEAAKIHNRHQAALRDFDRLGGQLASTRQRHEALLAEIATRRVGGKKVARAQEDIESLDQLRPQRQRAEGEAAELLRTLEADEDLAARLVAAERKQALVRKLRAGLEEVVAVTHRTAAPRLVSEAYLAELVDEVDGHLEAFEADFRVRLGPALGFVADFVDGRSQPAARLSEGQKSILALAFWVAVNCLFAGRIGLLCLDEPTANLNEQNLGVVATALRRLRELSGSLGLQCLLVTHERGLTPLFDDVIQL